MLGLGLSLWNAALGGGGGGITPEAQQFFDRVSDPGAPRKVQYATMIDALVAGGVWAKLDALYIFAAADQATALENLKQDLYNATSENSATFTVDAGFTGNSFNMAINSGFNPSTAGGLYAQNSANTFVWSNKAGTDTGAIMGMATGANAQIYPFVVDTAYAAANSVAFTTAVVADGTGLIALTRRGANETELYKNGASVATGADGSTALSNFNIVFLRDGAAAFGGQIMCGGLGSQLSDAEELALYNAVHVYLQAVAGLP